MMPHASVWILDAASLHKTARRGSEKEFVQEVSSRYTKSTSRHFDARAVFVKNASRKTLSQVR